MIRSLSTSLFNPYRTVRGESLVLSTRSFWVIVSPESSTSSTIFEDGGSVLPAIMRGGIISGAPGFIRFLQARIVSFIIVKDSPERLLHEFVHFFHCFPVFNRETLGIFWIGQDKDHSFLLRRQKRIVSSGEYNAHSRSFFGIRVVRIQYDFSSCVST